MTKKEEQMEHNTGIDTSNGKVISHDLAILLAEEYFLYLKTLNFHWNITGENFIALHQLLEKQYDWLRVVIDDLAERIRALGHIAPGTYKDYAAQASAVQEGQAEQSGLSMIKALVNSHEAVIRKMRDAITKLKSSKDYASEDMLIKILGQHEKQAWILRSHIMRQPQE
jgi:starvation-inducible DNA-binding protein